MVFFACLPGECVVEVDSFCKKYAVNGVLDGHFVGPRIDRVAVNFSDLILTVQLVDCLRPDKREFLHISWFSEDVVHGAFAILRYGHSRRVRVGDTSEYTVLRAVGIYNGRG